MNIIDAHEIYEDFLKIYDDVKIGAFNLGNMGLPKKLLDRIAVKNKDFKHYKKSYFDFINEYKHQKINNIS